MVTRRKRLAFLRDRLDELADEIERSGAQREVIKLADKVRANPTSVSPISDAEWDVLLPEERRRLLPRYYLTVRSEFLTLHQQAQKADNWSSWLNGPAPQLISLATGIASLLEYGYQALNAAGVLAHEHDGFGGVFGEGRSDEDSIA